MNIWKLHDVLREEEYEYPQGAGEVFDAGSGQYEDESQQQQQQQQPQQSTPAEPQPPSIPIDQLPRLVQALQPQPQQPALTQEQIDEKLKKVRITPEVAAAFFGEGATDQQVKFLQSFVDQIVEHATTINGYALQHIRNQFQEQYTPLQQYIEQQKVLQFSSALIKDYPALKGRENLVHHVIENLKAQNYRASSGEEAARVVAAHVEHLVKQVDPNFTLVQQQQTQQQQPQTMPKMAGMPVGAGGTASPGGGNKEPAWLGVFK